METLNNSIAMASKTGSYTTNDLSNLLFNVEKVPFTDYDTNSDYAYSVNGYPNGNKTLLNQCSNVYTLVPNNEIFAPAREILVNKGINFSETYDVINNARFYGQYVLDGADYHVGGLLSGDVIKPILKINHSYNGLTKYAITFGYYRLICTNGLVIPVAEKSDFNIMITGKHTKLIHESINQLNEKIQFFCENTNIICKGFDQLAQRESLDFGSRVIEVLNFAKIAIIDNSKFNTLNYVENIIIKEAAQLDIKVNDWLIYNGINQYINDASLNIKAPEVRSTSDKLVFDYLVSHQ